MASTQIKSSKQTRFKRKEPSMYNVIMHNDDVTTMDFVVMLLCRVFRKSEQEAESTMLKIHHEGSAIVGSYFKDIAETKAAYCMTLARHNGYPLLLTTEEAS